MDPKVSSQPNEEPFSWSENTTVKFLTICREYQKKHGEHQPFAWAEIAEQLQEEIGKPCDHICVKNKFNRMKGLYCLWNDLKLGETGIGWDSQNGYIVADDSWWERKIKENPKYKIFRNRGISPHVSDLWDQIFRNIVATGKHCVAPGMDVYEASGQDDDLNAKEDELNDDSSGQDDDLNSEEDELNDNSSGQEDDDLNSEEDELDDEDNDGSDGSFADVTEGSTSSLNTCKRKRKSSAGALFFEQSFAKMAQTSEKMLALLEYDVVSSTRGATEKMVRLKKSFVILEEMVQQGFLIEGEPLWCFTVDQLISEDTRKCFVALARHSQRLSWMRWRFDNYKK